MSALVEAKCDNGHPFRCFIQPIGLFNLMSKNFSAYKNVDVHASKKKSTSTPVNSKKSLDGQRILKLTFYIMCFYIVLLLAWTIIM